MGTVTIENSTVISQKNERELSAIPLWGVYLKKENQNLRDSYSIIHNTKIWKHPKCSSTDEWVKEFYTFIDILTHI